MIYSLSLLNGMLYRRAIKPILFLFHPDKVHSTLIKLSRFYQRLPLGTRLVRLLWGYQNKPALAQTINSIHFENPVGLAAGFDKNAEMISVMHAVGYGFVTVGSVTHMPCAGNPHPWFHRLPKQRALVVYAGLANEGVRRITQRVIHSYKPEIFHNFPVVMSVAKTNSPVTCDDAEAIADYIGSLRHIMDVPNIPVVEINISCPNTYGGEPFTDPERLEKLLLAFDELEVKKPVWIKMPINLAWSEFDALVKVILNHNIQGLTIGNLNKSRSSIPLSVLPPKINGNLSGYPTQSLSDDLISRTYKAYGERLTIIGVGGISNAADAYRKICLGASLVALISGLIYEGPQLIGQINHDLVSLLHKDGFTNLSQAVGSAHRKNTIIDSTSK